MRTRRTYRIIQARDQAKMWGVKQKGGSMIMVWKKGNEPQISLTGGTPQESRK